MLLTIIGILIGGFVIGGLARLAVPGPDPMPVWMTILIGFVGSIVGGVVGQILLGRPGGFLLALVGAILLVIGYRRFVQHRPITGPEGECCGGYLTVGAARLWLDPDHASNLADRVRAAIDQVVLSNFPSPTQQRRLS